MPRKAKEKPGRILRYSAFWHEQRAIHFSNQLKRNLERLKAGQKIPESRIWILAFYAGQEGLAALAIEERMLRIEEKKAIAVRKHSARITKEESNGKGNEV